jgi:hypothetical protein
VSRSPGGRPGSARLCVQSSLAAVAPQPFPDDSSDLLRLPNTLAHLQGTELPRVRASPPAQYPHVCLFSGNPRLRAFVFLSWTGSQEGQLSGFPVTLRAEDWWM